MELDQKKLERLGRLAHYSSPNTRIIQLANEIGDFELRVSQEISQLPSVIDVAVKKQVEKLPTIRGEKGDKGDTPTQNELISLIKPLIPKPLKGDKGDDGKAAEVTQETLDSLALSVESQIPEMLKTHFETVDASQVKNLEKNINIKKVDTSKLEIDASQVKNLPENRVERVIERGGGSNGLERILSGSTLIRQGATEIVFGDNLTVTRTPNGVKVEATGGSGSALTAETPTGTVDDSNTIFTVSNEPLYIVVNGAQYRVGEGAYESYSGGTITLAYPVGTGGFISSYYNA